MIHEVQWSLVCGAQIPSSLDKKWKGSHMEVKEERQFKGFDMFNQHLAHISMHLSLLLPRIYLGREQSVPCWTHGVRSSSMWWRVQWPKWPLMVGVWSFTLLRQEAQHFQQHTRPQPLSCPDMMILELISSCNDMRSHIKSTVAAVLAVNVKVQPCKQNTFSEWM